MSITEPMTMPTQTAAKGGDVVDRHRLSTRIWHWINAATMLILLMSGLMIFNAHPRLYWGRVWRQSRLCLAGDWQFRGAGFPPRGQS